jgi:hypothetical protein
VKGAGAAMYKQIAFVTAHKNSGKGKRFASHHFDRRADRVKSIEKSYCLHQLRFKFEPKFNHEVERQGGTYIQRPTELR